MAGRIRTATTSLKPARAACHSARTGAEEARSGESSHEHRLPPRPDARFDAGLLGQRRRCGPPENWPMVESPSSNLVMAHATTQDADHFPVTTHVSLIHSRKREHVAWHYAGDRGLAKGERGAKVVPVRRLRRPVKRLHQLPPVALTACEQNQGAGLCQLDETHPEADILSASREVRIPRSQSGTGRGSRKGSASERPRLIPRDRQRGRQSRSQQPGVRGHPNPHPGRLTSSAVGRVAVGELPWLAWDRRPDSSRATSRLQVSRTSRPTNTASGRSGFHRATDDRSVGKARRTLDPRLPDTRVPSCAGF